MDTTDPTHANEGDAADETARGHRGGYIGLIDWLNRRLMPAFGPPPIGPFEAVIRQVGDAVCPICRRPMAEHVIDHSAPDTLLICPADPLPSPFDRGPLNELGMPKRHADD